MKYNRNLRRVHKKHAYNVDTYTNQVYIDPGVSPGGTGSYSDPYSSFSEVTVASDTEYLWKAGTTDIINTATEDNVLDLLSHVRFSSFDGTTKPIIKWWNQSTNTGDWTEISTDIWTLDNATYTDEFREYQLLGLGTLGNVRIFRDYYGTRGNLAYNDFEEYGQWGTVAGGRGHSARAPATDAVTLAIYNDENPVTTWGTIYYGQLHGSYFRYNRSNDIKIHNLRFENIAQAITANYFTENLEVYDCEFIGCSSGIQLAGWAGGDYPEPYRHITNCSVHDCYFMDSGKAAISFNAGTASCSAYNNEIYHTGYVESVGAIYDGGSEAPSDNEQNMIYDNIVDYIYYGAFWPDGDALYADGDTRNVWFFRNYVRNAAMYDPAYPMDTTYGVPNPKLRAVAALRSNANGQDQRFFSNVVDGCFYGIHSTTKHPPREPWTADQHDEIFANNTCINIIGPAVEVKGYNGLTTVKNNAMVAHSDPYDNSEALNISNFSILAVDEDFNLYEGYDALTDGGSNSSIVSNLELDPYTGRPVTGSGAEDAGIVWWTGRDPQDIDLVDFGISPTIGAFNTTVAAANSYVQQRIKFDGTARISRSSQLLDLNNYEHFTISFWYKIHPDSEISNFAVLDTGSTLHPPYNCLYVTRNNYAPDPRWTLSAEGQSDSPQAISKWIGNASEGLGGWHHVYVSVSRYGQIEHTPGDLIEVWHDGAFTKQTWNDASSVLSLDSVDEWIVGGGRTSWERPFKGYLADVVFDDRYYDPKTTGRFMYNNGNPPYLGTDGSRFLGRHPLIYFGGDATEWKTGTNRGRGGNFDTIDNASTIIDIPNVDTYVEGSIYSGTKDVTDSWATEAQATGVTCIKVSAGTVSVNIGWGTTPALASVTEEVVLAGELAYIPVTGDYIGWQTDESGGGTVHIEQSVYY